MPASLERQDPQNFDLLVLDAFSGDSVPVHLLTREALNIYRRHVADEDVIALHATNTYFYLFPVVRALADDAHIGLPPAPIRPPPTPVNSASVAIGSWSAADKRSWTRFPTSRRRPRSMTILRFPSGRTSTTTSSASWSAADNLSLCLGRQAAEVACLQVQVQHALPAVRHEQVQVLAVRDHVHVRALVVMEVILDGLARALVNSTVSSRALAKTNRGSLQFRPSSVDRETHT